MLNVLKMDSAGHIFLSNRGGSHTQRNYDVNGPARINNR
jgi:hypothetical protein